MKNLKVFIFGLLLSQGYTLFSSARPLMPTFSDEELKHISDEDLGDIHCRTHYPTTQDATKALAMAANGLNYLHNSCQTTPCTSENKEIHNKIQAHKRTINSLKTLIEEYKTTKK